MKCLDKSCGIHFEQAKQLEDLISMREASRLYRPAIIRVIIKGKREVKYGTGHQDNR